jgi:hypothetical protein
MFVLGALALATVLLVAAPASAGLTTFRQFVGNVGLSTDGFGSLSNSGTISASAPAGATVLAAYLYSSTFQTHTPSSTLNGNAVAYGAPVVNPSVFLAMSRADVTGIVAPIINAGGGGIYNFAVTEGSAFQDGEALVVVYGLPSLPVSTVGILDGYSLIGGDSTSINFASQLDPGAPGFFADMRLGIGYSYPLQSSTVTVNGVTITTNAGNYDDGLDGANGSLITMGGFDDPYSPFMPAYGDDHERYNLVPQITLGDTSIQIRTINPSHDDNIFLATFWVTGEAAIHGTPEPGSSLVLLGLGLIGIAGRRLADRRSRQ